MLTRDAINVIKRKDARLNRSIKWADAAANEVKVAFSQLRIVHNPYHCYRWKGEMSTPIVKT
jgi:hypothetical protein